MIVTIEVPNIIGDKMKTTFSKQIKDDLGTIKFMLAGIIIILGTILFRI